MQKDLKPARFRHEATSSPVPLQRFDGSPQALGFGSHEKHLPESIRHKLAAVLLEGLGVKPMARSWIGLQGVANLVLEKPN